MPSPARLRDRITLERYNDPAARWDPWPTEPTSCWADVTGLGQEQYRMVIRWRPDLRSSADAEPATRVRWERRVDDQVVTELILDVIDVTETVPRVEVQLVAQGRQIDYDHLATGAKRKTTWP